MATNMRNITLQNIAIHELLRNMQNHGGYPVLHMQPREVLSFMTPPQVNYHHGKNEVQRHMASYQHYTREEASHEWKVEVDTSSLTDPIKSHSTSLQIVNQKSLP